MSKNTLTIIGAVLLVVGVVVAGPFNWFYDNASGTHFDTREFFQPISLLGISMVMAAFICAIVAQRSKQ